MRSLTTQLLSNTLGSYRKRIYACMLHPGSYFTLSHSCTNKPGKGQIYQCLQVIKDGSFTVIEANPVYGRNLEIKYFSGERFVYIQRN